MVAGGADAACLLGIMGEPKEVCHSGVVDGLVRGKLHHSAISAEDLIRAKEGRPGFSWIKWIEAKDESQDYEVVGLLTPHLPGARVQFASTRTPAT